MNVEVTPRRVEERRRVPEGRARLEAVAGPPPMRLDEVEEPTDLIGPYKDVCLLYTSRCV